MDENTNVLEEMEILRKLIDKKKEEVDNFGRLNLKELKQEQIVEAHNQLKEGMKNAALVEDMMNAASGSLVSYQNSAERLLRRTGEIIIARATGTPEK